MEGPRVAAVRQVQGNYAIAGETFELVEEWYILAPSGYKRIVWRKVGLPEKVFIHLRLLSIP